MKTYVGISELLIIHATKSVESFDMSVLNKTKLLFFGGGPWKTKNIVFYGFSIIIRICEYKNVTDIRYSCYFPVVSVDCMGFY